MSSKPNFTPTQRLIRWLSRRALRWVYREICFVGLEKVPKDGALLLFGNHPNDLPDVLAGFFLTQRPVRYIATVSATTLPLASATYRGLGVIPVARVRDVRGMRARGVDVGAVNRAAFADVRKALSEGEIVGVFPEGGVNDTSQLGTLRTGVAKMVLESANSDATNNVILAPFGLQYEAQQTVRSDVVVQVGEPFALQEWRTTADEATPVALSARLHRALLEITRNSPDWETAAARDRLVAAVTAVTTVAGERLLERPTLVQHRCGTLVDGKDLSQASPDSTEVLWRTIANPVAEAVARAGAIATSARDTARVLAAAGHHNAEALAQWPSRLRVLLATIPAALGLLLHFPLWSAAWALARRLTEVRTDPVAKAILPGLHLILLGYLALGGGLALGFRATGLSGWWAVPLVALLPRLGDLALSWRDDVRALRLRARVQRWTDAERAALCADAARIRDAWLALEATRDAAPQTVAHTLTRSL